MQLTVELNQVASNSCIHVVLLGFLCVRIKHDEGIRSCDCGDFAAVVLQELMGNVLKKSERLLPTERALPRSQEDDTTFD